MDALIVDPCPVGVPEILTVADMSRREWVRCLEPVPDQVPFTVCLARALGYSFFANWGVGGGHKLSG